MDTSLTQTIAKKDDASTFSLITMKHMPPDAIPKVKSDTVKITTACLSEIHPHRQDVAILQQFKNLGSGSFLERSILLVFYSSKIETGP